MLQGAHSEAGPPKLTAQEARGKRAGKSCVRSGSPNFLLCTRSSTFSWSWRSCAARADPPPHTLHAACVPPAKGGRSLSPPLCLSLSLSLARSLFHTLSLSRTGSGVRGGGNAISAGRSMATCLRETNARDPPARDGPPPLNLNPSRPPFLFERRRG